MVDVADGQGQGARGLPALAQPPGDLLDEVQQRAPVCGGVEDVFVEGPVGAQDFGSGSLRTVRGSCPWAWA
ncbi:hypothetical protein [Streptomyces sp. NPDC096033]|uniref:hypothetical protein n=1 Tax=Streptomyces sp. NPDC096033 TaxID=3366071 RepID=UPI00382D7BFC